MWLNIRIFYLCMVDVKNPTRDTSWKSTSLCKLPVSRFVLLKLNYSYQINRDLQIFLWVRQFLEVFDHMMDTHFEIFLGSFGTFSVDKNSQQCRCETYNNQQRTI